MAIVKWDPFDIRPFWRWPSVFEDEDWLPAIDSGQLDVYETKDEIVVKANVAGVKADEVDVTFEDGVLWIRGSEEEEKKEDKKFYRRSRRSYSYKVAIPGNIDLKKEPEAKVKDGVVTVSFKKAEEAKPKKITVKASS
jgi:HSP20 family protein